MFISHESSAVRSLVCGLAASLCVVACGGAADESSTSDVSSSSEALALAPPTLPSPTLAVPDGNRLAFFYDAAGVQIYACKATTTATATTYAWVFQAPEATLYGRRGKIEGKHYAGPTWESKDGSTVVGSKVAAFTADPTAIPELLLKAVSNTGDGRMSDVTYIQRLSTVGGLAPSSGCDAAAAAAGATARVDYTATYYFYRAKECDKD
jgi:uncharacterized protein DUF3455